MRNLISAIVLALFGISCSGCSICCPGYLDDYATVGGKWERTNPTSGRVGSILSDHGASVVAHEEPYIDSGEEVYYDDGYYETDEDGTVYESHADSVYDASTNNNEGVIILGDDW